MTAAAWAILIYTICTYPDLMLKGFGSGGLIVLSIIMMIVLTIKEIVK